MARPKRPPFQLRVPVDVDHIPLELQRHPAWIVWARDKSPRNPRTPDDYADVTDPATWGTYAEAVATYQDGRASGLGLVLTGTDLVALDFDNCRDPETGELAADVLAELVALGTYAEVSPSGTGVHAWIIGQRPAELGGACKVKEHREIYTDLKYLTVTGVPVGEPGLEHIVRDEGQLQRWAERHRPPAHAITSVEASPHVNLVLEDAEVLAILERCCPKKYELYNTGDLTRYDGDASSADLGLCNALVWAHASMEQADRLFRASALMRPKWDRKTRDTTYGKLTLAKAFQSTTMRYRLTASRPSAPPTRPPGEGEHATQEVATLKARLEVVERELAQALRRVELAEAERDKARELERAMSDTVQGMTLALRSRTTIGAPATTLAAIVPQLTAFRRLATQPEDGMYPISANALAEATGVDSHTTSRHMKTLKNNGPLLVEVRYHSVDVEVVDQDTGEIIGTTSEPRAQTYVGLATPTVLELVAAYASVELVAKPSPKPRPVKQKTCSDHPTAEIMVTRSCGDCGRILEITRDEQNVRAIERRSTALPPEGPRGGLRSAASVTNEMCATLHPVPPALVGVATGFSAGFSPGLT